MAAWISAKFKKIDRQTKWSKLRSFGNSHIAQATLLVPVLGYFLLFNEYLLDYVRFHTNFCSVPSCSTSWRIRLVYFGCCFIGTGSALYALRCPSVVKLYSGGSNFFDAERTYFSAPRNLAYLFDLIETETGKSAPDPFKLKEFIRNNYVLGNEQSSALADTMADYYVLQDESRPKSRYATTLFYLFGVGFLATPTIATFVQVVMHALS